MSDIFLRRVRRGTPEWRGVEEAMRMEHYLHTMPDPRTALEVYTVALRCGPVFMENIGALIFGRPEATVCRPWYGSLTDALAGTVEVTRWQVLNLARVWLHPDFQWGGRWYGEGILPGFVDRAGVWRSTLASEAIRQAAQMIGFEYLLRRPPVFLDEPYEVRWLMSYCDRRLHRGTIYRAAGFELYRTNRAGVQTWRLRLPGLTMQQDALVRDASLHDERARRYRAGRRASMAPRLF